jgi:hypothetical protein
MNSGHFIDSFVIAAVAVLGAITPTVAASQNTELTLLMVPLVGAVLMTGAAIMQATATESRRVIFGRSIFAVFVGVAFPQVAALISPKFNPATLHPLILMLVGGMPGLIMYFMSRPLIKQMEARSDSLAKIAMDAAVKKVGIENANEDEDKPK